VEPAVVGDAGQEGDEGWAQVQLLQ